jgi:hypothetical protein
MQRKTVQKYMPSSAANHVTALLGPVIACRDRQLLAKSKGLEHEKYTPLADEPRQD